MNAWNLNEIKDDPFNESCDRCNKLIFNWGWFGMSFISQENGDIICNDCRRIEVIKMVEEGLTI